MDEEVSKFIQGYVTGDIWNMDETACFFRALPETIPADARTNSKGGEKYSSVSPRPLWLIVNAAGGKELPIVIERQPLRSASRVSKPKGIFLVSFT